MHRWPSRVLGLLGLAVLVFLLIDSRQLAQRTGEFEIAARTARAAAAAADARSAASERRADDLASEVRRLEGELGNALETARALGEAVTATTTAREQADVARAAAIAAIDVPTPVGVQRCLQALRECLRADGFAGLRPLRAQRLADATLFDVEFLDVGGELAAADLLVAARMTATLDRGRSEVVLHFADGWRRSGGVRVQLPPEGVRLELRPVDGRAWAARLPFLLRSVGEWPEPEASSRTLPGLDPAAAADWLDRLDRLLADAGTELDLRVRGFADLRDGRFRDAQVCGYDKGRLLALIADCAELAVEIDGRAGIVSLLLAGGVLRRDGTESSIHRDGYRILLPNVTPRAAEERMAGMVVHR